MVNGVQLGQRFRREVMAPRSMIPLLTAPHNLHGGIALHAELQKQGNPAASWLLDLPMVRSQTMALSAFTSGGTVYATPYAAVSWPALLKQAELPAGRPLFHLVFDFLLYFEDVVRQHDPVFADDVKILHRNYDNAGDDERREPLFCGQTEDDVEMDRWNAHLASLLENEKFITEWKRAVEAAFEPVLGKVTTDLRTLAGEKKVTLFDVNEMVRLWGVHRDKATDNTDPWMREIDRIVAGFTRFDGCVRHFVRGYPATVLVDWSRIVESAYRQSRDTPLLRFVDPGDVDFYRAGHKVRLLFGSRFPSAIAARRHRPLEALVEESGATLRHLLESNPFELYSLPVLVHLRAGYKNRRAAALRLREIVRERVGPSGPALKNIGYLAYEGHDIMVIRRGGGFMFTIPYELYLAYEDRPLWEGKRYRANGVTYWTVRSINQHANGAKYLLYDENKKPLERVVEPIPAASKFRDWVVAQEEKLSGKGFRKLLYEQRYAKRIQEKLAGERQHMGRFTSFEDEGIRAFFEKRKRGSMTAEEWKELEAVAPQRTRVALTRRRDQFGFEYALRHGWTKYTQSGYCALVTVKRRKEWMRAGVEP